MTNSTRRLMVLVGAVAMLSLALAAVGPVLAQTGTGGSGNSVALQSGDTLGTIVSRYNLSGTDLRNFFNQNTSLVVQPGQTVTFPPDVTVNLPGQGSSSTQGQGTTGTSSSSGSSTGVATETATASSGGATSGGTTSTTGTPVATDTAAASGAAATGSQIYTTQSGDTLGTLLGFMGFTSANTTSGGTTSGGTSASGATSTTGTATTSSSGTTSGGAASTTDTPVATDTAAASGSTSGGTASTTGTPAATDTSSASGGTSSGASATGTATTTAGGTSATGSANGSTSSAAVTDTQLQSFVTLNSGLNFQSGQTVMLPAGIAVTGANQTGTPPAGTTVVATAEATAGATSTSGATTYTVQAGDTLQSIASRYGITVQQLLALNPNLLSAGQTINVPSKTTGSIPQTGNQQSRSFTVQSSDTLRTMLSRYGLTSQDYSSFFSANCDLTLAPGQRVVFPQGTSSTGSSSTTVTETPTAVATSAATETPVATETSAATEMPTVAATSAATEMPTVAATSGAAAGAVTAGTETPTVEATSAATSAVNDTPTVAATSAATEMPTVAATSGAAAGAVTAGTETPTVEATGVATSAATSAATEMPTVAATEMPTVAATVAATETPVATATVAATETPTAVATSATTSGGTGSTSTQANVYTTKQGDTLCSVLNMMGLSLPVTGGTSSTGNASDNQRLSQFVQLNPSLHFDNGQTVTIPAGIPATGVSGAPASSVVISKNKGLCEVGPGAGIYVVRKGDTLQSIANAFKVDMAQIRDLNNGIQSVSSGQHLLMPGAEAPGLWDNALVDRDCNAGPGGATAVPSR